MHPASLPTSRGTFADLADTFPAFADVLADTFPAFADVLADLGDTLPTLDGALRDLGDTLRDFGDGSRDPSRPSATVSATPMSKNYGATSKN